MAFVYIWFFRAVPRYVLMVIFGLGVPYLYPHLDFGVPFGKDLGLTFYRLDVNTVSSGITVGIIGLGLSEAAYMAEIARAVILSVDAGQHEVAQVLGMSRGKAMRRIILPQAMRVIMPPTGNDHLHGQGRVVAHRRPRFDGVVLPDPGRCELVLQGHAGLHGVAQLVPHHLLGAQVLQSWLERRFERGFGVQNASRSKLAFLGRGN